jgi:hypothetical protein
VNATRRPAARWISAKRLASSRVRTGTSDSAQPNLSMSSEKATAPEKAQR